MHYQLFLSKASLVAQLNLDSTVGFKAEKELLILGYKKFFIEKFTLTSQIQ